MAQAYIQALQRLGGTALSVRGQSKEPETPI